MGLCVDSSENKQGLYFEINRESVTFYDPNNSKEIFPEGYVEISKAHLKKIIDLCSDDKWKAKIFS